jgi:hypothetical protein
MATFGLKTLCRARHRFAPPQMPLPQAGHREHGHRGDDARDPNAPASPPNLPSPRDR